MKPSVFVFDVAQNVDGKYLLDMDGAHPPRKTAPWGAVLTIMVHVIV
jgi:hypothetical protein